MHHSNECDSDENNKDIDFDMSATNLVYSLNSKILFEYPSICLLIERLFVILHSYQMNICAGNHKSRVLLVTVFFFIV